jgi:uncharacterized peroxidase-related enzyme
MPNIPVLLPTQASEEVREIYDDFRTRMLFPSPPNFILTQGHASTVARGTWDVVRNVLVSGEIPRWTKEMIFAAISRDRNCHYCAAAHLACCRMLGVNPGFLESLVTNVHSMPDQKLRAMILFAIQCSRDPQSLAETDFQQLRVHGLGQSHILELIAMSALAVYANILADATAMEEDAIFSEIGVGAVEIPA